MTVESGGGTRERVATQAPARSSGFDGIAPRYERDSLVQRDASELLLDLLRIGPREDVLDLGCGTGHLAARIAGLTRGRVVGIDPSAEMIARATAGHAAEHLRFRVGTAETLDERVPFDVIFCNSAFQWFREPRRTLESCRRALRPGGRMGVQAPGGARYCPNFLTALERVAADADAGPVFAGFRSPWRFLESADEYAALFAAAGFAVELARIDVTRSRRTADEVMRVFESGAAAGYLDPGNYASPPPDGYPDLFRRLVGSALAAQRDDDGLVDLVFHRIYLVATAPARPDGPGYRGPGACP